MALAPMAVAVLNWDSVLVTAAACLAFSILFAGAYVLGIRWSRGARRKFDVKRLSPHMSDGTPPK
jgi:hypothetical protein